MSAPVVICPVCGYKGPVLEEGYCPNAVNMFGSPVTLSVHVVSRRAYAAIGLVEPFPSVDALAEAACFYESYFHPHAYDEGVE